MTSVTVATLLLVILFLPVIFLRKSFALAFFERNFGSVRGLRRHRFGRARRRRGKTRRNGLSIRYAHAGFIYAHQASGRPAGFGQSAQAHSAGLRFQGAARAAAGTVRASAGAIIESDITLAAASKAIVIGFNVRPTPRAQALAEQEKVEIKKYNIIYDVVDDIRDAMEGKLSPEIKEVDIGKVEVRDTFKVPKVGVIAGCYVTEGKVKRSALVRVIRDSIQINRDMIRISSLKRFKDDAREVNEGYECGIGLENWQDLQVGDVLEIVETEEVRRKLEVNE